MKKAISAEELDRKFDDGEDISEYLDWSNAFRPNDIKRVNVDFTQWMVHVLDRHAKSLGVSRQSLIKLWIADRLKAEEAGSPQLRKPAVAQEGYLQEQQVPIRK